MIPKTHLSALQIIHEAIYRKNISWAFTSSVNMALQGLMVTPTDIDIQTDLEGANKISEELSEYLIKPVELKEIGNIRSHISEFRIEGVKVEVIAEMEFKTESGDWQASPN